MVNKIKLIDIFKIRNQILVAKNWQHYKNKLIISDLMTKRIEKMMNSYKKGLITSKELYNMILTDISLYYKTMKN